jgi:hypothetical protein
MIYKHLLRGFAERTVKNMEVLEQHYGPDDRYEVTQLVNSLLGLVVFPKEKALKYVPATPLSDLKMKGWPEFDVTTDNTGCDNLRKLIEDLCHCTAHDKIAFQDRGGKIGCKPRHINSEGARITASSLLRNQRHPVPLTSDACVAPALEFVIHHQVLFLSLSQVLAAGHVSHGEGHRRVDGLGANGVGPRRNGRQ